MTHETSNFSDGCLSVPSSLLIFFDRKTSYFWLNLTFNDHYFTVQYTERNGHARFPLNCFDGKKASSKRDRHHIPVQRSTTISALSVIISLYLKTSVTFTAWKMALFGVFLVRILPHSDWMQRYRVSLLIQSECLNAGKYGPEKRRIWTLTQCFS